MSTVAVGMDLISPRLEHMAYDELMQLYQQSGFDLVKVRIPEAFSTDPSDVQKFIDMGVKTVILRTADGPDGYNYGLIRRQIELPGGIAHYSYADLMKRHPDIQWYIEIGNEPNLANMDAWSTRWWALACYKELALNHLGHIDQPWRTKYPMLKWIISCPTSRRDTHILTQYMDTEGKDPLGDGGVLDYYDGVGVHLYGDTEVLSWNYDWPFILQDFQSSPYCKEIFVTEMGINGQMPDTEKARRYRKFITSNPAKVKGVAVFTLGRGTKWPQYDLDSVQPLRIISGRS